MNSTIIIIVFLFGMLVGIGAISLSIRLHNVGNLRVDNSDPSEGPYLFLEIDKRLGIEDVVSKDYVILDVRRENFIK